MLTRTSASQIIVATVSGAAIFVSYSLGINRLAWPQLILTWVLPVFIIFLTVIVGGLAWRNFKRIKTAKEPIDSIHARWLIAIGKSATVGGAFLSGFYLMVAILAWTGFRQGIPAPYERFLEAALSAFSAATLAFAGWWLEQSCLIPPADDELTSLHPSHG